MADNTFFKTLFNVEMDSMQISLSAIAERSAITLEEFIRKQKLAGLSDAQIITVLRDDLNTGGRIFGEFTRQTRNTGIGFIGKISNDASQSEFGKDTKYTWIAALVNTCNDCLPRHNETASFEEWEARGRPRTGWSVCREFCQCVILPVEDVQGRAELNSPLSRKGRLTGRKLKESRA